MADNFCEGPATPIAPVPAGNKGGSGVYDKSPGYPERTGGGSGVPEKFYDSIPGQLPQSKD